MIRSIPPKTSTGGSRAERGGRRKPIKIGGFIKIGPGQRKEMLPQREERIEPIRSWSFTSKPKFARYSLAEQSKEVMVEKIKEPSVRILENVTETIIVAHLPGVEKKDIHIEVHGDILEISAKAKDEFGFKKYAKEILLPFIADPETIESSFEDNILQINLHEERKNKKRRKKNRKKST